MISYIRIEKEANFKDNAESNLIEKTIAFAIEDSNTVKSNQGMAISKIGGLVKERLVGTLNSGHYLR